MVCCEFLHAFCCVNYSALAMNFPIHFPIRFAIRMTAHYAVRFTPHLALRENFDFPKSPRAHVHACVIFN